MADHLLFAAWLRQYDELSDSGPYDPGPSSIDDALAMELRRCLQRQAVRGTAATLPLPAGLVEKLKIVRVDMDMEEGWYKVSYLWLPPAPADSQEGRDV